MGSWLAWWLCAELCGVSAYGTAAALAAAPPATRAGDVRTFDIPAQSLESALMLLLRQGNVVLVFSSDLVEGLQSRGVQGTMTVGEAFNRLLAGTPVVLVQDDGQLKLRRFDDLGDVPAAPSVVARSGSGPPRAPQRDVSTTDSPGGAGYLDRSGMTVTGSHIRQWHAPLSPGLLVIDRHKLEREGLANVPELVDTIPQNFGGGATEDTTRGLEAETNSARGFAFNLRAMGAGGTLPLFNGRRLAPGGSEGSFVDAASLALSALEQIEILPAAASPIYGSDAVGGVVNFVTRHEPGVETLARTGGATDGGLDEYQLSQRFGAAWRGGSGVLLFEVFDRGALQADDRALARSDLRPFGGDNFDTVHGNPGTLIDGGIPYAIPAGQDGRSLEAGDLAPGTANRYDQRAGSDFLPEQRRVSSLLSLRHDVSEIVSLYTDVLVARRNVNAQSTGVRAPLVVPASNPFFVSPGANPFVFVNYDLGRDLGPAEQRATLDFANAALGAHVQMGRGWLLDSYVGYGLERQDQMRTNVADFEALALALADPNPDTAFNPFGDGSYTAPETLDAIRARLSLKTRSQIASLNVRADGPVVTLPGGEMKLAVGAEYRAQEFESSNESASSRGETALGNEFDRGVGSLFAELRVPLVGEGNARPGLHGLEMSLAARYEHYDDFGEKAVPGLGLSWSPYAGLTLRGSWAKSFKAPNLADIDQGSNFSQLSPLVDPQAPQAGAVPFLLTFGKNQDLQEETATNWTAGVDLAPSWQPGLALSLTYFDVASYDRVQEIASAFPNLADPRIAPFIHRDPTPAEREAVCLRSTFLGMPEDCLNAPLAAIADLRIQNITRTRTNGVDLRLNYARQVGMHALELDLLATRVFDFEQSFGSAAALDLLDTQTNPLDLKLRSTLSWDYEGWGATLALNYADDYRDVINQPARRIDAYTSFDAQLRYEWAREEGWLGGVRASVTVRNLFDEQAPFYNNPLGIGYDQENADLNGRTVRLLLAKRW